MVASRELSPSASGAVRGDLVALLARAEAAAWPDRELDFWLTCYFHPAKRLPPISRIVEVAHIAPSDEFSVLLQKRIRTQSERWSGYGVPRLTASLDAALALCERVLPTIPRSEPYGPWEWRVHGPNRNDAGLCRAALTWPQTTAGAHVYQIGPVYGKTPALALIAALLTALIADAHDTLNAGQVPGTNP